MQLPIFYLCPLCTLYGCAAFIIANMFAAQGNWSCVSSMLATDSHNHFQISNCTINSKDPMISLTPNSYFHERIFLHTKWCFGKLPERWYYYDQVEDFTHNIAFLVAIAAIHKSLKDHTDQPRLSINIVLPLFLCCFYVLTEVSSCNRNTK
jgi:hypothetical protein